MEEMRQSLKIIEQVSVQIKRQSTGTPISECDQWSSFLLFCDVLFG